MTFEIRQTPKFKAWFENLPDQRAMQQSLGASFASSQVSSVTQSLSAPASANFESTMDRAIASISRAAKISS
jgi:hypothetical protein